LDVSGNWNGWVSQGQNNLHQSRQHTQGNQIQSITNLPLEPKWAEPEYDDAGNLIEGPAPKSPQDKQKIVYDAWNRPVTIDGEAAKLTYDGLGRLIVKETAEDTRRFTYSPDWQLLEEEVTPQEGDKYRYEYIWGARGPDDLICREKYFSNSKIPIRHYALADANGNVVGVVDEASGLLERQISYDPYGQPVDVTEAGDFAHLFGGYYYDHQTGLYLVRNRVYHPTLGRWLQNDPAGHERILKCKPRPLHPSSPSRDLLKALPGEQLARNRKASGAVKLDLPRYPRLPKPRQP
ncbi:MAG: RHS repeat-associated core domain-containing protein, partial [Pirellulaceae bacterium]